MTPTTEVRYGDPVGAPEYGPPRRVYGECDCDPIVRIGGASIEVCEGGCASREPVRYERDRLVDCPEGCVEGQAQSRPMRRPSDPPTYRNSRRCPTCPDEHPGKVVARQSCRTCNGFGVVQPPRPSDKQPCPDCNGAGVETERITRERVLAVLLRSVRIDACVPLPDYNPSSDDELAFVLAILEAGLL